MVLPDYQQRSIVNLMGSVACAYGLGVERYTPLPELPPEELLDARSVVLLVVDGLGYDYLLQQMPSGALAASLRGRITSVFPSTTACAITSFLTGVAPLQHGLTGWFTYWKALGGIVAPLPFRSRHGGPSLDRTGIEPRCLYTTPPLHERFPVKSYLLQPAHLLDSAYSRAHQGGAELLGYGDLHAFLRILESLISESTERRYVYAYWPTLDSLAHTHGIASAEATAHLEELDGALSRLSACARASGARIVVTADHGFVDSPPAHRVAMEAHPSLVQTLSLPLCGEPRAAYCYVHPGRRRDFEAYAVEELGELSTLRRSQELVEEGYFGQGDAHPALIERIGDYTLLMKGDYTLRDRVLGEMPVRHVGAHGGVSGAEMYVPLILLGGG